MSYKRLKIMGRVTVTSCKSRRSGYISERFKMYLGGGSYQNRLINTFILRNIGYWRH